MALIRNKLVILFSCFTIVLLIVNHRIVINYDYAVDEIQDPGIDLNNEVLHKLTSLYDNLDRNIDYLMDNLASLKDGQIDIKETVASLSVSVNKSVKSDTNTPQNRFQPQNETVKEKADRLQTIG